MEMKSKFDRLGNEYIGNVPVGQLNPNGTRSYFNNDQPNIYPDGVEYAQKPEEYMPWLKMAMEMKKADRASGIKDSPDNMIKPPSQVEKIKLDKWLKLQDMLDAGIMGG